jgi:hypothetical protein
LGISTSDHGRPTVPYVSESSRASPGCFLFLIDQSSSMAEPFGAQPAKPKAEGVADGINRLLQNLALKCAKSDGIRDYFHVGVIGYGKDVHSALGGSLAGRHLVPVSEFANNPLRVEKRKRKVDDGAGGVLEQSFKFPVWFEPVANGQTPMTQALALAGEVLQEFINRSPECFPPLVINITDGRASDGNPAPHAQCIRDLASRDGNVLLFNVHLSARPENPIELPDQEAGLPDDHARLLFRMSSELPPQMRETAQREGYRVSDHARGFVFNGDLVSVIRFLDIGTRVDARNMR